MIFETVNSQVTHFKDKTEEMMRSEPAGTTICLVEHHDFAKGETNQLALILYPIGGTVSRKRILNDRVMGLGTQSIPLPAQVTSGERNLSEKETDQILKTLSGHGIWNLPHSKKNEVATMRTTIAITNGCQTHAFVISNPEGIFLKLQAILLSLVTLPHYSL